MKQKQCRFNEPWRGQCGKPVVTTDDGESLCCAEHAKEKCSVCGAQALTRCQASIGLMCGVPLCDLCGHGEMCLSHASRGPLMVIRALLGGGPAMSIFGQHDIYAKDQKMMDDIVERLKRHSFRR